MKLMDALSRIERVGQEHSRATEKLIQAAQMVADEIVSRLGSCPDGLLACGEIHGSGWRSEYYLDGPFLRLACGEGAPRETLSFQNRETQKCFDRETALVFAADIAGGLLDRIEQKITEQLSVVESGLTALKSPSALRLKA